MNNTRLRRSDYFFLFIVLIGFYLLYRFSIFTSDDFYYSFIGGMSGGINDEYIPVNSLTDAIKSNIHDYMNWNGRFLVHVLTSYFCGVIGVDIFRVLNSIVFILLIIGLIKLVRYEFGYNKTDKYIITFGLFFLMPVPGEIFLGHIANSVNYLWVACAVVYFLFIYQKVKDNNYNNAINILLFVFAFIVGSLQESFTIGVSTALFFYYCFHLKEFKGNVVWLVIGFWLGTCALFFAPGNFKRLDGEMANNDLSVIVKFFSNLTHLFLDSYLLLILIVVSFILFLKKKDVFISFFKRNIFFLIPIVISAIIVAIVLTGKRQLTCVGLFSLILLIKLLYTEYNIRISKSEKTINILISIILVILYVPIYNLRKETYQTYVELQNSDVENSVIINDKFMECSNRHRDFFFSRNYTYSEYLCDMTGLSLLKTNGKNPKYITAVLPREINEIVSYFENTNNEFYYDKENKCYYFRRPIEQEIKSITLISKPYSFLRRIRNKIFNRETNNININRVVGYFIDKNWRYFIYNDQGEGAISFITE